MRYLAFGGLVAAVLLLAVAAYSAPPQPPAEMAYCTQADIKATYDAKVLAQRTGDPTGETINETKLQAAIERAADRMRPYVEMRYGDHDFGTDEPYLMGINVEYAMIELNRDKPAGLSETDREDQLQLIALLKDIAHGGVLLKIPVPGETGNTIDPDEAWRSNPRLFTRNRHLLT